MTEKTKNFTTTYRGPITDIATIARWLVSNGVTPRSRNELVNCAVTNFADKLRQSFPELAVLETSDALNFLTELGLVGANLKNMQPTLSREFWNGELIAGKAISNETELVEKAQKHATDKLAADAMELVKRAENRQKTDAETAKQLASVSNLPISSDENSQPKD